MTANKKFWQVMKNMPMTDLHDKNSDNFERKFKGNLFLKGKFKHKCSCADRLTEEQLLEICIGGITNCKNCLTPIYADFMQFAKQPIFFRIRFGPKGLKFALMRYTTRDKILEKNQELINDRSSTYKSFGRARFED